MSDVKNAVDTGITITVMGPGQCTSYEVAHGYGWEIVLRRCPNVKRSY